MQFLLLLLRTHDIFPLITRRLVEVTANIKAPTKIPLFHPCSQSTYSTEKSSPSHSLSHLSRKQLNMVIRSFLRLCSRGEYSITKDLTVQSPS